MFDKSDKFDVWKERGNFYFPPVCYRCIRIVNLVSKPKLREEKECVIDICWRNAEHRSCLLVFVSWGINLMGISTMGMKL